MTTVIENPDRKRIALIVLRGRLKLEVLDAVRKQKVTVLSAKHWLGIPRSKRMTRTKLLELVTKELENYG